MATVSAGSPEFSPPSPRPCSVPAVGRVAFLGASLPPAPAGDAAAPRVGFLGLRPRAPCTRRPDNRHLPMHSAPGQESGVQVSVVGSS